MISIDVARIILILMAIFSNQRYNLQVSNCQVVVQCLKVS